MRAASLAAAVLVSLLASAPGPRAQLDDGLGAKSHDSEPHTRRLILDIPLGLDLHLPTPDDNRLTRLRVELGRDLFFDQRLSRDGTMSCASCHRPELAFTDGRPRAEGVGGKTGLRNTPTLVNRAYGRSHFFDGRAATLEEQALQPIEDPDELAADLGLVIERLRGDAETTRRFRSAFEREVDPEDLGRALAAYLRTILAGDAPVDRYQAGDLEALDDEQLAGLRLFRGKAGCARCHLGPNLTDEAFHVTGVAWRSGILEDPGRFAVSGEDEDRGAFKTPTLREIARTAPYMHDGSVGTLEDVVELYDRGGVANPHLDRDVRALGLSEKEKRALVAFLRASSGRVREGVD